MYIYDGWFIPLVPSQNDIPSDIKFYHFRRDLIQGNTPHFTHSLFSTIPGQHCVRVVLCSPLTKSEMVPEERD